MKKKLLKLSLAFIISAAIIFVINYFFFHFVTDAGITLTWQPEAGKPFVADLIGNLGVLSLFGSLASLFAALILFGEDKK